MIQTVEALVAVDGKVHLLSPLRLLAPGRAFVTILEEKPMINISETALLSEAALAADWSRAEEDEAWSHLQPEL